jgi:hypothetical protein
MAEESKGQILVTAGKEQFAVLTWLGMGKAGLLDGLDALKDVIRESRTTPLRQKGERTGAQIVITHLDPDADEAPA